MAFDPSAVAEKNGNFFGFPYTPEEAEVLLLCLPWDVTTSYRDGTSRGPRAMREASTQLDFFSPFKPKAWDTKVATLPERPEWFEKNRALRLLAKELIDFQERGGKIEKDERLRANLDIVNKASSSFHAGIADEISHWLEMGKKLVTVGGDHSAAYGSISAHAAKCGPISILHLDAHADLRHAYEGFPHSHASVMRLVSELPGVERIVQVGIRDVSPDEIQFLAENQKFRSFFDWDFAHARAKGIPWDLQAEAIVKELGSHVYISFDIDGLDPRYCPHTGTPVPGGLDLADALYLFEKVVKSGRKIVGADLVEVAPGQGGDEWDANVGARILFQLCQFLSL